MINYDIVILIVSIIIGGSIALFVFIQKDDRSKQLDHWLGLALFFLLGYKLLPIIDSPSMILKPMQLLILKSGDIGLLSGFFLAFLYWVYTQLKLKALFEDSFSQLIIVLAASYTVLSFIHFEIYIGQFLGLYRGGVGLLFLFLIKFKPQLFQIWLIVYGGALMVIESLAFSHLYWGFSLIQWLILFVVSFYLLINLLQRRGRSNWQEK